MAVRLSAKEALFSLVPSVAILLCAEITVRAIYYQKHAPYAFGLAQVVHRIRSLKAPPEDTTRHVYQRPFFRPDPVTGYSNVPGEHEVSLVGKSGTLKFRAVINADGYRTTSPHPESHAGQPELWIFGCSYTWGFGLNNEDSFPWLIQSEMPDVCVRNLAGHGYGNVQALLQLKDAIDKGVKLPVVAVFSYNPFHRDRNVALPSWLLDIWSNQRQLVELKGISPDMGNRQIARASLNAEGNFEVSLVPLRPDVLARESDPDPYYRLKMTQIIFYRLLQLCHAHNITPVIALQSGDPDDEVFLYARQLGYTAVNMSLNLDQDNGYKYRLRPYDTHVNKLAHQLYKASLMPVLKECLTRRLETIQTSEARPKR
jgi:hypothetical protein